MATCDAAGMLAALCSSRGHAWGAAHATSTLFAQAGTAVGVSAGARERERERKRKRERERETNGRRGPAHPAADAAGHPDRGATARGGTCLSLVVRYSKVSRVVPYVAPPYARVIATTQTRHGGLFAGLSCPRIDIPPAINRQAVTISWLISASARMVVWRWPAFCSMLNAAPSAAVRAQGLLNLPLRAPADYAPFAVEATERLLAHTGAAERAAPGTSGALEELDRASVALCGAGDGEFVVAARFGPNPRSGNAAAPRGLTRATTWSGDGFLFGCGVRWRNGGAWGFFGVLSTRARVELRVCAHALSVIGVTRPVPCSPAARAVSASRRGACGGGR